MKRKARIEDAVYERGYVYNFNFHLIWCTKYRQPAFTTPELVQEMKDILMEQAKLSGITVKTMEVMPDHIHLLADCKPQLRLSDAIKILKGNTARWLFMAHPEIKQQLWGGHLWNPSYFVATVSDRSREQVMQYINSQKTQ